MHVSFALAVACYLGGLLLSLLNLGRKQEILFKFAFGTLAAGLLFHTLFLTLLTIEGRHLPIYTSREAFSLFAWLVTVSFFASYLKYRIQIVWIFVLPLVAAPMLLAGSLGAEPFPANWKSYWVYVHTALVLVAYAQEKPCVYEGKTYEHGLQVWNLKGDNRCWVCDDGEWVQGMRNLQEYCKGKY